MSLFGGHSLPGLLPDGGQFLGEVFETIGPLLFRDELDVLVGEVETGLEVREQFDQIGPQPGESPRKSSGQLPQRRLQFDVVLGVDHPQHGFGLDQVDPSGEEGSQGEFSGSCRPDLFAFGGKQFFEQSLEHRWRPHRVDFGRGLPGVAATGGPEVEIDGKLPVRVFGRADVPVAGVATGRAPSSGFGPFVGGVRSEERCAETVCSGS